MLIKLALETLRHAGLPTSLGAGRYTFKEANEEGKSGHSLTTSGF